MPDFIREEALADIFRHTAHRLPDKVALVFGGHAVTYRELDAWSDTIAAQLQQHGIGSGDRVGVWYPRGLELHAAILGITKSGAAYIPIDRDMPVERVETILQEVEAKACFALEALEIETDTMVVEPLYGECLVPAPVALSPGDWAYVLYTSGSTGKPKGIPITHRQICHLIRSENSVIQVQDTDRVYQGFSVSFDMWCEETWISYFAGATLYVADAVMAKSIDELSSVLRTHEITVLHAVPSLLGIMDAAIPTLRIINAGGEACTNSVLEKWAGPGRVFYNSYGPTETTVTSSMIALKPGDTISIGKPLPNYNYAVIDEQGRITECGQPGELVISGPCVGSGYIKLPELTAAKFIQKPLDIIDLPGDTLYKTGDNAIIHATGEVEFLGRIDDQIKLRGYRIELGEIENSLAALPGVTAAAVAVKKDAHQQEELVGYVLWSAGMNFDEHALRAALAKTLASYMVPAVILPLEAMPRLASGKINRKALPLPPSFLHKQEADIPLDKTAPITERMLAVLSQIFPGKKIELSDDFFTDLGGHSLLAAMYVSKLRNEAGMSNASLKDVYQHRPLGTLAEFWSAPAAEPEQVSEEFQEVPWWRYSLCALAQTVSLLVVFGLFAAQLFFPYLAYYYTQLETESHLNAILVALAVFCLLEPLLMLASVGLKWLIIGKIKEGDYPLWGSYYFRWWLVNTMQDLVPVQFLNGTPLYPLYLRLRGVKVAPNAMLSSMNIGAEDLLEIGDDVSISSGVVIDNATVEKGMLRLRKVTIGSHAYIGSNAVIGADCVIQPWGELKDLSYLPSGATIRTGEVWNGSPAVCIETKQVEELPQPPHIPDALLRRYTWMYVVLLLIFPLAVLIPLFPVLFTLNELDNAADDYDFRYLVITPVLSLMYTFIFAGITIISTRLLQKNIKPGMYPVYSSLYIRKWLADQFMSLSLLVMHPVYATVYISTFFRALGAKVGKYTEISTARNVTHPMLSIGENAFIADAVTLGETDVRAQSIILQETSIGDRSFVGNSALIPQGYHLPPNMLIGVLSTPPPPEELQHNDAKDWFGSPAIALPSRQSSAHFDESLTRKPSRLRYIVRAAVELIRIIIPETVLLCCSLLFIAYVHDILVDEPWWQFMIMFPLYFIGFIGLPCFAITFVMKWTLVGRYKSVQMPMWTYGVWRSEAITTIYESLAGPFFLEFLKGTPWLPFFLRFLGVKIGKRVWMNTTDITEFDKVDIGDDVALNTDCGPQTHLFEDHVMKIGTIKFGARSSIGTRSIILYDSEIGENVRIDSLSLVMKGEYIPANTNWGGSPVKKSGA